MGELILDSTTTDRTDAINQAVVAEYIELRLQGYTQDQALSMACRNVIDQLDGKTRAELRLHLTQKAKP